MVMAASMKHELTRLRNKMCLFGHKIRKMDEMKRVQIMFRSFSKQLYYRAMLMFQPKLTW